MTAESNFEQKLPLVSVIIPVYNGEKFLSDCLNSILNQTYPQVEIVLVDDGSTDGSMAIAETFSGKITLVRQKNSGVSIARNKGIIASQGDYLAFLDQDDFWYPEKLSEQLRMVNYRTEPCFLASPVTIVDSMGTPHKSNAFKFKTYIKKAKSKDPCAILLYDNFIHSSSPVIHKDVFLAVGGFEKKFEPHDDFAMYLKICSSGFPFYLYTEKPLSIWRKHSSNESQNQPKMLRAKSRIYRSMLLSDNKSSQCTELRFILSALNLERLNYLLYKKDNLRYKKLAPGLIANYIKTYVNCRRKSDFYKFHLIAKSLKRYLISVVKSLFQ